MRPRTLAFAKGVRGSVEPAVAASSASNADCRRSIIRTEPPWFPPRLPGQWLRRLLDRPNAEYRCMWLSFLAVQSTAGRSETKTLRSRSLRPDMDAEYAAEPARIPKPQGRG